MGLDMYARTLNKRPSKPVDFFEENPEERGEELHYWRKHPDLHGWMEELYRKKGGKGEEGMDGPDTFNVVPVIVDAEDLDELEIAVKQEILPTTAGFFFGESTPEDKDDDLIFIKKARDAIAAGKTVFYYAWW